MKNIISIIVMTSIISIGVTTLSAQRAMLKNVTPNVPNFQIETITTASSEKDLTNLDVYLKIAYDELQFIKNKNNYQAIYEISITIFNESGDRQEGRVLRDTTEVNNFFQTNSREDFSILKTSFLIKHNNYRINIGLMDFDTRKTGFRRLNLSIPEYDNGLAVSDILLLDYLKISESGDVIRTPNISNAFISESSDFQAYYEIYGAKKKIKVKTIVADIDGKEIYSMVFDAEPVDGVIKIYDSIKQDKLKFNRYMFIIEIGKGRKKVTKRKMFRVRWFGMAETITDLDKAVEYLTYIAPAKEIRKMLASENEEKRQLFTSFWKKRDPSPESEVNELMIEYYKRIKFTNDNFASFQDGWKADMGMVYILYGTPNDIERHPFNINSKPYEVWYYYDLNRNFVFQDDNGFGDYKLVTPMFDTRRSDF